MNKIFKSVMFADIKNIQLYSVVTVLILSITQPIISGTLYLPKMGVNAPLVHHGDYSLAYSEEHEQAYWVSYELTKDEVLGKVKRKDDFREDPKVKTGSATLEDYRNSGYNLGHLKPAADSKEDALEMSESFYFSNISPQNPSFNRGIWKELEELVRGWAIKEDTIYVITGPILSNTTFGGKQVPFRTIGKSKVSIPKYFYKIILDLTGEPKAIGFVIANSGGSSKNLKNCVIEIDRIELVTKIDFFHELPDSLEERLESTKADLSKWSFKPFNLDVYKNKHRSTASSDKGIEKDNSKPKPGGFSLNKKSGVRHNSNCKAYNCKNCVPINNNSEGRPCGSCGG